MTNPTYTHYPLSVATISLTPMQPWQDELIATVQKMLTKIDQPFDGSVSINLQITRKIVALPSYKLEPLEANQYKPAKMENADG